MVRGSQKAYGQIRQSHLELISQIYGLPLQQDGWQAILDKFSPMMNAKAAFVTVYEPLYAKHHIFTGTSNFDPSYIEEFNTLFSTDDPFAKLVKMPKRAFLSDMEILGLEQLEDYAKRPAIQWMNRNHKLFRATGSHLNLNRAWTDILCVLFSNDRGPITDEEKLIGDFFLSHFTKAMELSRAFNMLQSRFNGILTALDRFHIGIFILSPHGSVILKNAEAERIIMAGDGLVLSQDKQLYPTDEGQRAALKQAIIDAVDTAHAQQTRAQTLLTVDRRSGKDPYLVEVAPIRDDGELESRFKGCLIFVIDPTRTDVVSTEGMQALYTLTNSESKICKLLAKGFETNEIADTQNITRETVRNYIKQVLKKTGTNNRSQLVRLALNVNLPIDPASYEE